MSNFPRLTFYRISRLTCSPGSLCLKAGSSWGGGGSAGMALVGTVALELSGTVLLGPGMSGMKTPLGTGTYLHSSQMSKQGTHQCSGTQRNNMALTCNPA